MTRSKQLRVLLTASVAVLVAPLLALVSTVKAADAAFPGENGKILFAESGDFDLPQEIYSGSPDGSGATRLTILCCDSTEGPVTTPPKVRPTAGR